MPNRSRADQLDSRTDSPMREDQTNHVDDAPVNGNGHPNQSPDRNEHQSNGFTAVNGDSQESGAFVRPNSSAKLRNPFTPIEEDSVRNLTPVTSSFHSHGWRPSDHSAHEQAYQPHARGDSNSAKRKRTISLDVNGNEHNVAPEDGEQSAKRRTASTLDSAIDLTSPLTTVQTQSTPVERRPAEPISVAPYVRRRTPQARWNQGDPPPRPSLETEALLAESVNKFHRNQQEQEAQRAQASEQAQTSPNGDREHQEEDLSSDDEPQEQNNKSDPKKPRKRNFSNRTKTGCHTCRERKKKCDEGKPSCANCSKGGFNCQGYGPKAPGKQTMAQSRNLAMQAKGYDVAAHHAAYQAANPNDETAGRSYSHWGRVPEHEGQHPYERHKETDHQRYGPSRESWTRQPWTPHDRPPAHYHDRFPPPDLPSLAPQLLHMYSGAALAPHQTPFQSHSHPIPTSNPFAAYDPIDQYHRPSHGPATVASARSGSDRSGESRHTAHLALQMTGFQPSEKDKMMRGLPFFHWLDNFLIGERDSCSIALDRYNNFARSDGGISREEKTKLFAQILDPARRRYGGGQPQPQNSPGLVGTINDKTIVESPFKCEYGYNIHIGSCSVIQAGCFLQDAATITIGDRVIISPDVKIHCLTASVDPAARNGSQGHVVAGAVTIEDDVFIGANVLIMPYTTIGKGAVVGAGAVVTRDVTEYTVVAGNPAKPIRRIEQGGNPEKRHAYEIQERNERVKKRMQDFANSGFTQHSPRLI